MPRRATCGSKRPGAWREHASSPPFRDWTASATTQGQQAEALAAVMARLAQPDEAFQRLEENLGRGLLDELAARGQEPHAPGK